MEHTPTFFSYARSDSEFVLQLAKDLRKAGADVWLDQLDIKPGSRWDLSIEHALKASGRMIVIISPDSISSNNVMDEVSFALEEGKEVVPVLFKPADIPFRLRRLQHVDFTANYNEALHNLFSALNLGTGGVPAEIGKSPENEIESHRPEKVSKQKAASPASIKQEKPGSDPDKATATTTPKKSGYKLAVIFVGIIAVSSFVLWSQYNKNDGSVVQGDIESDTRALPLENQHEWESALSSNTVAAYQNYLKKYPNGTHVGDAWKKIDALNNQRQIIGADNKEWKNATAVNTIASFKQYLKLFPTGENHEQAHKRIDYLEKQLQLAEEENARWNEAQRKNTIQGYKEYLSKYRLGRYSSDAVSRINELTNKSNSEQQKQIAADFDAKFAGNWFNTAGTWLYGISRDSRGKYIRTGNVLYYYAPDDVAELSAGFYKVAAKSTNNARRNFHLKQGADKNSMSISGSATSGFNSYWRVVGRSVRRVTFSDGSFAHAGGKRWIEKDAAGTVKYTFNETGRDDWSVYLQDTAGRGLLQIDIHRKTICWTPTTGKKIDLYRMTGWYNN
ncbi:MAG: TIR domain-containing protein [Calditrichaeota bacterium]|nr:MAG: TIR domain-containing protein [Calditrichota bacterium]